MHTIFGRFMKYILRIISMFIIFLLLLGLSKFKGNISNYIDFLNSRPWKNTWQQVKWDNPFSITYIFRGSGDEHLQWENNLLTGEISTGAIFSGDNLNLVQSGNQIDAYDPSLETDLNNLNGEYILNSGNIINETDQTNFGFTGQKNDTGINGTISGDSKQQLLNVIKRREMNK
ncbi:MAG: hypothetical protein WC872_02375 [Candidatus Absconditabacterales bacterium]